MGERLSINHVKRHYEILKRRYIIIQKHTKADDATWGAMAPAGGGIPVGGETN